MSVINFKFSGLVDVRKMFDLGGEEFALLYLEQHTRIFQMCQNIVHIVHVV